MEDMSPEIKTISKIPKMLILKGHCFAPPRGGMCILRVCESVEDSDGVVDFN